MELMYAPTSPYVRKTVVVARELGLLEQITLLPSTASPVKVNSVVNARNPLGKIPALMTAEGQTLCDSPVICEYLASLVPGNGIFPAAGPARWTALRDQALADGLMDAALLCRYELIRPEDKQWADWTDGQMRKVTETLAQWETGCAALDARVDIGTISIACALGFLDFRFAAMHWKTSYPALAAWFDHFSARPSIQQTVPVLPA